MTSVTASDSNSALLEVLVEATSESALLTVASPKCLDADATGCALPIAATADSICVDLRVGGGTVVVLAELVARPARSCASLEIWPSLPFA